MAPARKPIEPLSTLRLTLLLLVAIGCALVLLCLPRSTAPRELPYLVLPKAPVEQALRDNQLLAAKVRGSKAEAMLERVLVAQARAERETQELAHLALERRKERLSARAAVIAESGERGLLALRAAAAERLRRAMALELPEAEARDVLGGFPNLLEREGCAFDGALVVPYFAAHVLYLARFNLLFGKPADHAFSQLELRAFHGVSALHAERLPILRRIEALYAYGKAGGPRVEEALAVLLFRKQEHAQSAAAFTVAYEKTDSLRLRNHARAARDLVSQK